MDPLTFVDPRLAGRQLYHPILRLVLDYQHSFVSPFDDTVYYAVRLARQSRGTSLALGSEWTCPATDLRVIVPKEDTVHAR